MKSPFSFDFGEEVLAHRMSKLTHQVVSGAYCFPARGGKCNSFLFQMFAPLGHTYPHQLIDYSLHFGRELSAFVQIVYHLLLAFALVAPEDAYV